MEPQRKLVTIRVVSEVKPIPGADNIELCVVDGWQCVTKKGEFQVGDRGIYFEIDSFLPIPRDPAEPCYWGFLRKDAREWNGMFGARIRTIKLRGQISQGLLLSSQIIPSPSPLKKGESLDDLSSHFGVIKYEKELPPQVIRQDHWVDSVVRLLVPRKWRPAVFSFIYSKWLKRKSGISMDSFPSFLRKTDEERVQNLIGKLLGEFKAQDSMIYEATIKLDGSSMTVYVKDGVFGLCSRNVKKGIEDGSNFAKVAKMYNLPEILPRFGWNIALQGELVGPSIQGNNEELPDHDWFIFNIWDIDKQKYLTMEERDNILAQLNLLGCPIPLKKVPSLGLVNLGNFKSIDDYLTFAEGPSLNPKSKREGVVFRSLDGTKSFKAISNSYLLKNPDRS
jgi:hypothetical protein